jgi:hypothetical protein
MLCCPLQGSVVFAKVILEEISLSSKRQLWMGWVSLDRI